jgi:hypothetical protein
VPIAAGRKIRGRTAPAIDYGISNNVAAEVMLPSIAEGEKPRVRRR